MGKRVWKYRLCDIATVCGCNRVTVWRDAKAGELVPSDLLSVAGYIVKRTSLPGLRGIESSGVSVAPILASLERIEARLAADPSVKEALVPWEGTHRAMPHGDVGGVDVDALPPEPNYGAEACVAALAEVRRSNAQELLTRFKGKGMNVGTGSELNQ